MKKCIVLLLMIGLLASCTTKRNTYIITDSEALEELFSQPQKNIRVILESGDYHLTPEYFIDQTCGNCQDPNTAISATRGITISGKNVSIIGPSDRSAIIHTHAGYGIYIKDLQNGVLENLTITGTIRDTAQMATDAAIVVSKIVILQLEIVQFKIISVIHIDLETYFRCNGNLRTGKFSYDNYRKRNSEKLMGWYCAV